MNWQVYIILCTDDTLYTGITTDIERRLRQHANGRGAKYFRGRLPKMLLYLEGGHDRSSASKRELSIKGMRRPEKQLLVGSGANIACSRQAVARDESSSFPALVSCAGNPCHVEGQCVVHSMTLCSGSPFGAK